MISLSTLLFWLVSGAAPAAPGRGVYFEQTTVTYVAGSPQGPGVVTRVWSSGRRMRLESGDAPGGPAFILQMDKGAAYRVEPQEKRAVAIDAERLRARSQMDAAMAGDLMGADEEGSARTSPLGVTRTIAGLPCQAFRLTLGSAVLELCVTRSLGIGVETFAEFLEWSGASQGLGGLMEEIRKLPGFPLETRSRVSVLGQVHETRSTLTKVEVGPLPPSLFEPPPGYTVVPEEEGPEER